LSGDSRERGERGLAVRDSKGRLTLPVMKAPFRRAHFFLPLVLASCSAGADEAPQWIRLARLAGTLSPASELSLPGSKGRALAVTTNATEARVTFEFQEGDWKRGQEGFWGAALPAWTLSVRSHSGPVARATSGAADEPTHAFQEDAPYRLRDERGEYELWLGGDPETTPALSPRGFTVIGTRIFVNSAGEKPPERLALEVREERGPVEEGARRFLGDRFSGEGLLVWPGEALEMRLELPPRSALTFGLAAEPRLHRAFERGGELVYRIELDGKVFFEERVASDEPVLRWRSVPLPSAGGPARLSFSVQGPFAHTAFLAPTVGPREKGTPLARPWSGARPDVIVFLADTFRADNLAAYGGRAELAPFLNDLAARSLLFTRAWSTAPYTLAAHASLFTGFFPRQAGIVQPNSAIPRELFTLAEFFAELGYRTGAVTDQGFVSRTFGMDQGFQYFDEKKGTLAETAERVRGFLEADDGRPMLLFVQTYRTHATYSVSDEACAALSFERLASPRLGGLDEEYDSLADRAERTPADLLRMTELARELEGHYRATVWDLDRGFERVFRELEAHGSLRSGTLVFTSDHGEAFGEHGELFHGSAVDEEQVRIPLFLHGPALQAGRADRPVSLLDLPRTLADLVGVEPRAEWLGASLLGLAVERPIYAFQSSRRTDRASKLCVIEGNRKVIGLENVDRQRAESLCSAFDLESDPGELRDLLNEGWSSELYERHRSMLDAALQPRVSPTTAAPTAEQLESLEDMGYAGGDD